MLWIWENTTPRPDEYADFRAPFVWDGGAPVTLRVSVDSNYAAYVNGELAAFGQYADYPHYKVADERDITAFCRKGENELVLVVWYYGDGSSVYCPGRAGAAFAVASGERVLAESGADTLTRPDPHYVSHRRKIITGQLGYSWFYDAAAPETEWHPACLTGYAPELHPRPILPLELQPLREGRVISEDGGTHFLLDLGCEEVGFLFLRLTSEKAQRITVAYGEHIVDGCVRRIIGGRDFSVEYGAVPGENEYLNPFRRLGARYLEIFCEAPVTLSCVGLRPTMYPVREIPFDAGTPERQAIYDVCVRTLRLCMHEHYEDCPWREQALYAMDSRNQILTGFYAFGEKRFARASLALMAQDRRRDGLLAITYPCGIDLTIPSFSLHYFIEMREYAEYTGDVSLAREAWDKLVSVLRVFDGRIGADGLIPSFVGAEHWNFYEWSDGLAGTLGKAETARPDLLLNCLYILAVESMERLAGLSGMPFSPAVPTDAMREAIRRTFLQPNGLYADFIGSAHASELGNSLALLAGVPRGEEAAELAARLVARRDGLVPVTLSMKCFLYDALLAVDRGAYRQFILDDIDEVYGRMLAEGATSVWETDEGATAFGDAGSLCHGWSALPVYYYHILL